MSDARRSRPWSPEGVPVGSKLASAIAADEEILARQKLNAGQVTLAEMLASMGENGVTVWHLSIPGSGELIFFAGADAAALRAKALAACYGEAK